MTALVIDCSIALTWCFADEASPETDRILDDVRDNGAIVPALWHLEVANVLLQAERRGRITSADTSQRLRLLGELPIATDPEAVERVSRDILPLARGERLTSYDAAYLELAIRRGLPLATMDEELKKAASRLGVAVFP